MSNFVRSRGVLLISIASFTVSLLAVLVVIATHSEDSEPEDSLTLTKEQSQKAGIVTYPQPQLGDPYVTIVIELDSGDVVLEKGFWDVEGTIEVIRLTHDGFVVIGERRIHIDTLAAVIERLAIAHEKAETE